MTYSDDLAPLAWPGFQADGGLLLPVPSSSGWKSGPDVLEGEEMPLARKAELHVTLLNRAMGSELRSALGDITIARFFEEEDWTIRRTGDGYLLRKIKIDGARSTVCESLIERLDLPALARFRLALGRATGARIPEVLPHITLYVAGDAVGIGLPDMASFETARMADLRLPGVRNRTPPSLPSTLLDAYKATDFMVDDPAIRLRVGQPSARMDAELRAQGAARAIVVTAWNAFSEDTDLRANALRQHMLRHALESDGQIVRNAEGRDPAGVWPPEPSLLVMETDPTLDDRLLRDYEQHAIVVIEQGEPVRLALHPHHRIGPAAQA